MDLTAFRHGEELFIRKAVGKIHQEVIKEAEGIGIDFLIFSFPDRVIACITVPLSQHFVAEVE
jgi:hypothetical protein